MSLLEIDRKHYARGCDALRYWQIVQKLSSERWECVELHRANVVLPWFFRHNDDVGRKDLARTYHRPISRGPVGSWMSDRWLDE